MERNARRCAIATRNSAVNSGPADTAIHRQQAAERFAIDAARLAADTRCHSVIVLDVRGISPFTDYFVIATGTSPRQMRTACRDIEDMAAEAGWFAMSRSGYEGETWILVDFVDVVVHIFSDEARRYYDLEGLWGDGRKVRWDDAG